MGNEWFTPSIYIEAARRVMGGIDLDPASCEMANRTVQAARYYTQSENGLMQVWQAKTLWLNPPYGKTVMGNGSYLEQFTRKLVQEHQKGNVREAILLIPVNTATSWFPVLWQYPICFPSKRIRFNKEDNTSSDGAAFGTCFVYFGANEQRFLDIFGKFGPIVKQVSQIGTLRDQPSLWEVA